MAANTKKSTRKGPIRDRSQVLNPSTGHYILRDTSTGQFMDIKTDGKPFKGVKKEKSPFKANPSVEKETAEKAERAVFKLSTSRVKKRAS